MVYHILSADILLIAYILILRISQKLFYIKVNSILLSLKTNNNRPVVNIWIDKLTSTWPHVGCLLGLYIHCSTTSLCIQLESRKDVISAWNNCIRLSILQDKSQMSSKGLHRFHHMSSLGSQR